MEKISLKSKLLPFILTFLVIILDQLTKALVVKYIPLYQIGASFLGGFFRIVHVCNTGVAFSVGAGWSDTIRHLLFLLLPLVVIVLVIVVYFKNKDFTALQRWAITGIIGGGLGNLIDRFFRAEGVVDFLDFQWFGFTKSPIGLFRMTRWPTFNVADSAVVICGILLIISFIVSISKESKDNKAKTEEDSEKAEKTEN